MGFECGGVGYRGQMLASLGDWEGGDGYRGVYCTAGFGGDEPCVVSGREFVEDTDEVFAPAESFLGEMS